MPKLSEQDWRDLRDQHKAAFTGMAEDLFTVLLDKVYGPKREGNPGNDPGTTGELDEVDALMICLARSEPGIPPEPPQL